ncbi:DUF1826 domain-containing protein [Marinobacterium rhizophilum]|uniref:DUF1826 domain-containing protein n=1 Tax=Marinobacterium rhizophilum TaxID=420402 RepID=A0ABY5HL12_9GAMM|nr:DUF1826 domain-containing protein [Marinobacterium rhizophilum]UTW13077.1 DUF1826 domain-containing protein [Marinobacterium rhizophilum]
MLTHLYQEPCNLAIWQRQLSPELRGYVQALARQPKGLSLRCVLGLEDVNGELQRKLPIHPGRDCLIADIELLVDMFSCLFEQRRVGLRLEWLTRAMCPKFHVDHLPCRLVTTYLGRTTHWISHEQRQREPGNESDFQQLAEGDVALLKGEGWFNNEGRGILHRSPDVAGTPGRLFLSLDTID